MTRSSPPLYDVLIVGAGPAGLAAAIAARRRSLSALVIEQGALVNSLLHYPTHMVFFTTPELLEIGGLPFVSPHEKPTRDEALRYYRKVTDVCGLSIAAYERVTAVRKGADGVFRVTAQPRHGEPVVRQARAVVLATGAYDFPNRLDIPGEDLPHVSHFYTEAHPYYRQQVVIVGGKNSAADAALELYRAGASVTLVHRGTALGDSIKYWVRPDLENRIQEGAIRARFSSRLLEITMRDVLVEGPDGRDRLPADAVLLLTGYHADTLLLKTAGAEVDDRTYAPTYAPDTFETTVPGLFCIGSGIAGQQSGKIFIENGRFHGEVAIRTIAERIGPSDRP